MVYIPTSFLGRFVLGTIALLYILLLVLNLVSFGGLQWITYVDYNVQFGLWRVCYGAVSASRSCSQWSGDQNIVDSATNVVIFSGKPGFISAAEGLEIISLIFYVFAGLFIIIGIIDLPFAPLEYMFGAAALLIFLCIVFLSASLGVMSKQGRDGHPGAYLDWAWWIGMLGLVVMIIFFVVLIGFLVDVALFSNEKEFDQFFAVQQQQQQQQQPWNFYPPMTYPQYNQWYPQYQQNISPLLEMMARQHFLDYTEAQRQQQFGYPYEQSFINTYF